MEAWAWQWSMDKWFIEDGFPIPIPPPPPHNRVYEEALISHQMLHPNVPLRPF